MKSPDGGKLAALSVPGKTFLVGEYLALKGGPSLILNTRPRFTLYVTQGGRAKIPFVPRSPAGRLFLRNQSMIEQEGYGFEFQDPHVGRGGLGASTAQYALLWAWLNRSDLSDAEFEWSDLLREYRELSTSGTDTTPPSGADLVSQIAGSVTCFDGIDHSVELFSWTFPSVGFAIFRTGYKVATHEHLKTSLQIPANELRLSVARAIEAFENSDDDKLISSVLLTAEALRNAGLVASHTAKILSDMQQARVPGVLAAKGCGALGADIILCLTDKSIDPSHLQKWARENRLTYLGCETDLDDGLRFEMNQMRDHL